ncbi:hypothetical protein DPMN_121136 [Dreissena polymorpha]|uniref:Uncharacterized protein n=1 Tax=Dreissena polymorpha TaxID=45954 RepID=A0A9D4GPK9_DREPO|nr:hypothetical protein DPMN_121136 [Dreissena polymorpha]
MTLNETTMTLIYHNGCLFFLGRWMFEVMLGSKGVMQVGWCTLKCKFSQEVCQPFYVLSGAMSTSLCSLRRYVNLFMFSQEVYPPLYVLS